MNETTPHESLYVVRQATVTLRNGAKVEFPYVSRRSGHRPNLDFQVAEPQPRPASFPPEWDVAAVRAMLQQPGLTSEEAVAIVVSQKVTSERLTAEEAADYQQRIIAALDETPE